jgi:hypothetical protein
MKKDTCHVLMNKVSNIYNIDKNYVINNIKKIKCANSKKKKLRLLS